MIPAMFLAAVAALCAAVIGWLVRIERRDNRAARTERDGVRRARR